MGANICKNDKKGTKHKSLLKKYIHTQFYQLIIIPISHMSSFNMLSTTTQAAMFIQNFKTIVIVTQRNHSITNVYVLSLIHIKIK